MKKGLVVVGLVGGIGSGKSMVASLFGELGAEVADADALAHRVLERTEVKRRLAAAWGTGILSAGKVDRAALAAAAFRSRRDAERLNAIVHPAVRREIRKRIRATRRAILVVDAPLLLEAGADRDCTAVVFVAVPRAERERRAARRGMSPSEFRRRERLQWAVRLKKAKSDYVLNNAGSRTQTKSLVRTLCRDLTSS